MTTPQSGREAFEELVERWRDAARGIRPSGTWNGNDLADRYEWCADELEAALAEQELEVGEPGAVDALVSAANATLAANPHDDTMWTLEEAVAPFNATKPAECENGCPPQQVCDYCQIAARYTAAPKQQAVEVPMSLHDRVEFALRDAGFDYDEASRIALLAALPGKTEVDRG